MFYEVGNYKLHCSVFIWNYFFVTFFRVQGIERDHETPIVDQTETQYFSQKHLSLLLNSVD